jgi:hypothetical protein
MQIAVEHTIKEVLPKLEKFSSKQAPFSIAKALTRTAMKARVNANKSTRQYFDKPVPFTQRAFKFKSANKQTLTALVYADRLQARYLAFGIAGGARRVKGFERKFGKNDALVPTRNIKANSAGNIPLATIKRMQAQPKRYLVGTPAGGNRPAGIYERTNNNARLKALMIFKDSAPKYRKRFPLEDVVAKTVKRHFATELAAAYREAIKTAR